MQPVLDHLKPRLKDNDHALLMALVAALSARANLEKMYGFQLWCEIEPVAIEEDKTILPDSGIRTSNNPHIRDHIS